MIKVAVIGAGPWGRNIIKTLSEFTEIAYVFVLNSPKSDLIEFLNTISPLTQVTNNLQDIFTDESISHVFIATPPPTHYAIAKLSLLSKKHTFVEKPLSVVSAEVNELYKLASSYNVQLTTGYIYLFDESLQLLHTKIQEASGLTLRLNWEKWGTFESPLTVNLLVHELAIAAFLLGDYKHIVTKDLKPDIVILEIAYKRGTATITVNRAAPVKRKWLSLDTPEKSYQLENGQLSLKEHAVSISLHNNDVTTLLKRECESFLHNQPITDGSYIDSQIARVLNDLSLQ